MATTIYASSGDGFVRNNGSGSWSSLQSAGTGTVASQFNPANAPYNDGTTADKYIDRGIFSFDLSAIPAGATITAATLRLYVTAKSSGAGGAVGVTSASPASTTTLATSDFGLVGSTEYATRINFASATTSAYNDFALNSAGLTYLEGKIGTSAGLAVRGSFDIDNSAPGTTVFSLWSVSTSEHTGTSQDPILTVSYSLARTTGDAWAWSDYAVPTSLYSLTFSPSAGDGKVRSAASGTDATAWGNARSAGTGTSVDYTSGSGIAAPYSNNNLAGDATIDRLFLPFDTSSMPSASAAWSGTVSFVADNTGYANGSLCLVAGTQASTSVLATSDFDEVGSTELAYNRIPCSTIGSGTRYTFVLNAAGVAAINKTGFSKFAVRTSYDLDNTYPAPESGVQPRLSEYTGTTSDPILTVSYGLTGKTTNDAWAWSDGVAVYRRCVTEVSIHETGASTQLNGANPALGSTITVDSTTDFPSSGTIWIADNTNSNVAQQAYATYTGKTSTTFTGCSWTAVQGKVTAGDGSLDYPDNASVTMVDAESYFPQITPLAAPGATNPPLMISWTQKSSERGLNGGLAFKKSTDGGMTWGAQDWITTGTANGAGWGMFGHFVKRLKNGRLICIWYEHQYNYLVPDSTTSYWTMLTYSDDDGETWSTPVELDGPSAYGPRANFTNFDALLITDGTADATYGDLYVPIAVLDDGISRHSTGNEYRWYQKLMVITDGGTSGTWDEFATVSTYAGCGNRANSEGSIVVCANGDWLAAMRVEPITGSEDSYDRDVWMVRSTDEGATWGTPFKAIDSFANSPHLTVLPGGTIICTASDVASGAAHFGSTATVLSHDDGVTWLRGSLHYENTDATYTVHIGADVEVIVNDPAVQVNTCLAYSMERESQAGSRLRFRWYIDPLSRASDAWAWADSVSYTIQTSLTAGDSWAWSDGATRTTLVVKTTPYPLGGIYETWNWSEGATGVVVRARTAADGWAWSDVASSGTQTLTRTTSDSWSFSSSASGSVGPAFEAWAWADVATVTTSLTGLVAGEPGFWITSATGAELFVDGVVDASLTFTAVV